VEAPAGSASVRIGAYSLEVGSTSGSFAQFEPQGEHENANDLAAALEQEPDERPTVVAAIEEFEETADAVTGRIEQADKLLRTAADGRLLEVDNLPGEIDSLLDLFARLDRAGRFEEELRLMRSLNGLLALTLRWLDLIRSLRSLLSSAETAGHEAGQAFAHHELGSLDLCAGRPKQATEHLREASRLQDRIGDLTSRCATRHNLGSARRDLALQEGGGIRPPRRLQRLVVLAAAIAIAAASGAGIALAIHDGDGQPSPPGAYVVSVQLAGKGTGSVRGGGLACPNNCSTSVEDGRTVTLTAIPANGSVFTLWSGVDCGRKATCKLTVTSALTVTATFSRATDLQPPTTPTDVQAKAVSASEIALSWTASSDNVAVTGYVIYRDRLMLTTVSGTATSFRDTDLAPSTGYVYSVQAVDAAGNASPQSILTKAETFAAADNEPPTTPARLRAVAMNANEIKLSWLKSSDNVGVTGYVIYRDRLMLTTVSGTATSFLDTGLAPSTGYVYSVQAVDAAGNASPQSNLTKAKTPAAADNEPPTTPTDVRATALNASEIALSWIASSDNVAVTGYVIYRDGVELTTVFDTATSFRDTGLDFSTTYIYTVQAIDAAGNRSPQSRRAEATTGPG